MPYVQANGIRLYYELAGDGSPLLFISGTGGDGWGSGAVTVDGPRPTGAGGGVAAFATHNVTRLTVRNAMARNPPAYDPIPSVRATGYHRTGNACELGALTMCVRRELATDEHR